MNFKKIITMVYKIDKKYWKIIWSNKDHKKTKYANPKSV